MSLQPLPPHALTPAVGVIVVVVAQHLHTGRAGNSTSKVLSLVVIMLQQIKY